MTLQFSPLLAPISLVICAAFGFASPGHRPRYLARVAEAGALLSLVAALVASGGIVRFGAGPSPLIGWHGVGVSVLLDAVSEIMLLLVTFIGWVVVRYAGTYLDGEARQGAFTGWL